MSLGMYSESDGPRILVIKSCISIRLVWGCVAARLGIKARELVSLARDSYRIAVDQSSSLSSYPPLFFPDLE